jgi:maleate isomerase
MQDNFSFSTVTADEMRQMTAEVAVAMPDAIAIVCTNMRGAPLAEELEAKYGIPIYDTISTTVWGSLRAAGVDTKRVKGWGRIFEV